MADKVSEVSGKVVDSAKEFLNKEEVKETIEKVKDGTADIAEKAVNALKDWLRPDKEEDNKENKE